jgi:integrase/recombinase XerD
MYSITPILHPYKSKEGTRRITLQIIVNRIKLTVKTKFAVKESQFKKEKIVGHPQAEKYNYHLQKEKLSIENKLLEAFKYNSTFTKQQLDKIIKGKETNGLRFTDFATQYKDEMKHKLSEGRLKKYQTVINKISKYDTFLMLSQINGEWLTAFENHLRETNICSSTIASNIKVVKAVVRAARKRKLIPAEDFIAYTPIKVIYKEPDFLTMSEIEAFKKVCRKSDKPGIRIPGYYFLLSCYAGLRISDALKFDQAMVKNGELVYYAQKNKKRCAIPLYPALEEVTDVLISNPYTYHVNWVRKAVREIMKEAGIKRHLVYHVSRHTFCTHMLQKGFTIPEVAEMAGDTVETISRTYAHVDRQNLKHKVSLLLS